jgi:hypothetical protein
MKLYRLATKFVEMELNININVMMGTQDQETDVTPTVKFKRDGIALMGHQSKEVYVVGRSQNKLF